MSSAINSEVTGRSVEIKSCGEPPNGAGAGGETGDTGDAVAAAGGWGFGVARGKEKGEEVDAALAPKVKIVGEDDGGATFEVDDVAAADSGEATLAGEEDGEGVDKPAGIADKLKAGACCEAAKENPATGCAALGGANEKEGEEEEKAEARDEDGGAKTKVSGAGDAAGLLGALRPRVFFAGEVTSGGG